MADPKPVTVKVEALKYHTTAGEAYDVGDTYDVEEAAVENLELQGMAVRVDRVAKAKEAKKAASKPVAPMTTTAKGSRALAKPRKAKK